MLKELIKREFEEFLQKIYNNKLIPESFEVHEYLEEDRLQLSIMFNIAQLEEQNAVVAGYVAGEKEQSEEK